MRPTSIFAVLALSAQIFAAASAHAAVPKNGHLDFTVLRNGEKIGRHDMSFSVDGDALKVDIKTDIAVKVLFVTAYRFEHEGHEIWQNGRLVRLWSQTNDDGKHHTLDATATDVALAVVGDGNRTDAPVGIIPASLWNEGILSGGTVLNTLDGQPMAVQIQNMGQEAVDVRGKSTPANHFVVTGGLERELWFDAQNVLVKVRFKGEDSSDIEYVLR